MDLFKKISLLLAFSAVTLAGCDVEDVEKPTERQASAEVDMYWDEVDGAFYAFPLSEVEREELELIVEELEPRTAGGIEGMDELTTVDSTAAPCCKATCTNGYCKVPEVQEGESCSCACTADGQPDCKKIAAPEEAGVG